MIMITSSQPVRQEESTPSQPDCVLELVDFRCPILCLRRALPVARATVIGRIDLAYVRSDPKRKRDGGFLLTFRRFQLEDRFNSYRLYEPARPVATVELSSSCTLSWTFGDVFCSLRTLKKGPFLRSQLWENRSAYVFPCRCGRIHRTQGPRLIIVNPFGFPQQTKAGSYPTNGVAVFEC